MEYRTLIRAEQQITLIKHINVIPPNGPKAGATVGLVLYERQLHPGYKIAEPKQEEITELFAQYPKQEHYPDDDLDKLILETVRVDYPSSYVYNDLLFTAADVERLNHLTNRPADKADLVVCPHLTPEEWNRLGSRDIFCFRREVNIYAHYNPKHIKNIAFRGRCSFNGHNAVYQELDKIKFFRLKARFLLKRADTI